MTTTTRDKDRAKAIIVEIVHQSGGEFQNKTNLYKAFWRAHVEYAKIHLRGLSRWPIVRMPNGPGIHKYDTLIGELMAEEILAVEEVPSGPYIALRFHLIGTANADALGDDEKSAIRTAILAVRGKPASKVSDESHSESRAWLAGEPGDGDEIDVFLDAMSEEEATKDCGDLNAMLRQVQSVAASLGPQQ
jgi:hypothetical protein